jgi:Flp pilus assembly protein TadG
MTGVFGRMASSARAIGARLNPIRFARNEDGTITAFAAMMFVLMIGASGIAIDVMRYETQRAQLQYTLDRAILAAAALTQPFDPEGVVRNYFEISGLENYRLDVRVEQGLNFRRVHAYAEMEVRSMFMQLFGVRLMTSPAIGAAEERVNNIEVSMVLDISGSMGSNNRLVNLRPAAREFVTEVLRANADLTTDPMVSVSIVPYNGMVNTGSLLGSVYTFDNVHTRSNCPRFMAADFQTTALDPDVPIRRISHWDRDNQTRDQLFSTAYCRTDQYGAILPWQHEEAPLHAAIDALNAGGWTAIDVGMNWGVALLDPSAQQPVADLIAGGHVHPDFAGRPRAYDDDETIKVIVLMTDGANTNQYDLRDQYRTGYSPIFRHTSTGRWSIWWQDRGQFWIPNGTDPRSSSGSWSNTPYGGWAAYGMTSTAFGTTGPNAFVPNGTLLGRVLPWTELWENYTAEYIARNWLRQPANASGFWNFYNQVRTNSSYRYAGETEADENLRAICDAAHAAGIIIFAIGFEAPLSGQEVMRYCASSDAHYYDVEGLEINQAFASIARTINQLRLIQ